jgi:uncharacterized membrane protein YccC
MNQENPIPPEEKRSQVEGSWREVGQQFQALGESLSHALRTAWENETTQRRVQEMRSGLEAMANEIGRAVDDTAKSPQGQKVRQDAERAAETLRNAGEQTVQEVRPQLINALEQLNNELQKLINRMESQPSAPRSQTVSDEPPAQNPGSDIPE